MGAFRDRGAGGGARGGWPTEEARGSGVRCYNWGKGERFLNVVLYLVLGMD